VGPDSYSDSNSGEQCSLRPRFTRACGQMAKPRRL
jgi:hypothetical protein